MDETRRHHDELMTPDGAGDSVRRAGELIEQSPAVAFVWEDAEGWPVVYVSENVGRVLGWEASEFISRQLRYADIIHPEDLPRVVREVAAASEDPGASTVSHTPYRILPPDGQARWVEDMTTISRSADGRPLSYGGLVFDVTDRVLAEEALRERESRLRTIIETTADGFLMLDADGRVTGVNEAYCAMSGYTRSELIGSLIGDLDAEPRANGMQGDLNRLTGSGSAVFETRHRRKEGSSVDLEVSAARLDDAAGGYVCFCRDITERKRHQEETAAGHLRLLSIFDGIDEPIYVADPTTYEVLYVNEAIRRVFGQPDARKCYDYLQGRTSPCPFCTNDRILGEHAGKSYVWEFQNRLNDRWYRCIDKAIQWPDGRLVRYEMALDITDRKMAEEELRKFKTISDTAGYGTVITDLDGHVEYVNTSFAGVHGYVPEELLGQHLSVFHSSSQIPLIEETLEVLLRDGVFSLLEIPHTHRDGTEFPMLMNGVLMRDSDGEPHKLFATATDLRERKRLEAQVQQAQKLESVGRLAGGVAHDLNNLLVPIIGYSEMLLDDTRADSALRIPLEAIAQAGARARDLVRQLLAFSRKQVLEFKPVDLNEVLLSFEKLLRRTFREDIVIDFVLAASLPPIAGDIGQLEQVVMNLAVNARDAMPNGGTLTIETRSATLDEAEAAARDGLAPGEYVILAMSDTGSGMAPDTVESIFEPFFTTKGEHEGTGLGLATVYGIVKQHSGSISVYSEPGRGTIFEISLPATSAGMPLAEGAALAVAPLPRGPETILLVEDHEQVRELAQTILKRQGYHLIVAESGEDALERVHAYDGPIHLLLTDVVMREISGKRLFDRLTTRYPDLKVLYMSGHADDVISSRGVIDEGVHFIQKPFAVRDLLMRVREIIDAT